MSDAYPAFTQPQQRASLPPPLTGGSLSDLLTTAKNLVDAVNNLTQTYTHIQGNNAQEGISAATLLETGPGRVCTIIVTTAGSTVGAIYDANLQTATTNLIWNIPNTVGITVLNIPTKYGIVIAPGTSQVCTVSYS